MSGEPRVVSRQQFQNSQNIVEVTVRAKPRPQFIHLQAKNNVKFKRQCALDTLLEEDELHNQNFKENKPLKYTNVEICKKTKPPPREVARDSDESWGEYFQRLGMKRRSTAHNELSSDNTKGDELRNFEKMKTGSSSANRDFSEEKALRGITNNQAHIRDTHIRSQVHSNEKHNLAKAAVQSNNPICNTVATQTNFIHLQDRLPDTPSDGEVTHSPFGESGLLLLRQLKDKLKLRGDVEIVDQIESFLSNCNSLHVNYPSATKQLAFGSTSTPGQKTTFENNVELRSGGENYQIERFKVFLDQKDEKIKQQSEMIDTLKKLSEELLGKYNKLIDSNNEVKDVAKKKLAVANDQIEVKSNNVFKEKDSEDLSRLKEWEQELKQWEGVLAEKTRNQQKIVKDMEKLRDIVFKLGNSYKNVTSRPADGIDFSVTQIKAPLLDKKDRSVIRYILKTHSLRTHDNSESSDNSCLSSRVRKIHSDGSDENDTTNVKAKRSKLKGLQETVSAAGISANGKRESADRGFVSRENCDSDWEVEKNGSPRPTSKSSGIGSSAEGCFFSEPNWREGYTHRDDNAGLVGSIPSVAKTNLMGAGERALSIVPSIPRQTESVAASVIPAKELAADLGENRRVLLRKDDDEAKCAKNNFSHDGYSVSYPPQFSLISSGLDSPEKGHSTRLFSSLDILSGLDKNIKGMDTDLEGSTMESTNSQICDDTHLESTPLQGKQISRRQKKAHFPS